ncbi:MAG: hypothetical protein ACM3UY_04635 [Methanocella sp.]
MTIEQRKLGITLIAACLVLIGITLLINNQVYAQESISFSSQTPFNIPSYNATIFFAQDGTCNQATFENDTWVFRGLCFSNSVALDSFKVSARDCNVTVYFSGIFRGYLKAQESGLMQYNVTGAGEQQFNFGLSPNFGVNQKYRDLRVRFSSEFFTNSSEVVREGEGWQLGEDGTITVTGAVTGASILYADYSNIYGAASLPFYMRHSVTLAAVSAMLVLVAIGVALRFREGKIKRLERVP